MHSKEVGGQTFHEGDFVMDLHTIYILDYTANKEFEMTIRIYLNNIQEIKAMESTYSLVIKDSEIYTNGLEIKTENYLGMQDLIKRIKEKYNKTTTKKE